MIISCPNCDIQISLEITNVLHQRIANKIGEYELINQSGDFDDQIQLLKDLLK